MLTGRQPLEEHQRSLTSLISDVIGMPKEYLQCPSQARASEYSGAFSEFIVFVPADEYDIIVIQRERKERTSRGCNEYRQK